MDFDYESIRDRLIVNLRKRASWGSILPNSVNMRLIETFAEEEAELARYSEYLLRETKWNLARNRSSLFYQSSLLGYQPFRRKSARGDIEISSNQDAFSDGWYSYISYLVGNKVRHGDYIYQALIDSLNSEPTLINPDWNRITTNHQYNIGIPKFTEFISTSGVNFVSQEAITLGASQDFAELAIIEGVHQVSTFIATGSTFEEVYIENSKIEDTFYTVTINNTKWTEVDNLRGSIGSDFVFQTFNEANFNGVYFRFGDDTTGKQLTLSDVIKIDWIDSSGVEGNINIQNGVTTVSSSLVDNPGTTVPLYCTNYNSISGGKEIEGIESIRRNGILSFQAGDRLVSTNDYMSYLETNYDFIGKAVVWGAFEKNIDAGNDPWTYVPTDENFIYISAITPGSSPLDILFNSDGTENTTYKIEIIQDVQELKSPTDIITFEEVEFIHTTVNSVVVVENENYLLPEIVENVTDTLIDTYGIEEIFFAQQVYESNYISLISQIEGVKYHTSEFSFYKKTAFATGFVITTNLPLYEIETESVTIVAETLDGQSTFTIATDDGAGNFTPEVGYTLSGDSIDYTLGSLTVTLDTHTPLILTFSEYVVKVYYDSVSNDIIPKKRNQILFLDEDEISIQASYYSEI